MSGALAEAAAPERAEDSGLVMSARLKAVPAAGRAASPVDAVAAVLSLPDEQLDYARAKIAFDRIVDPTVDEDAVLAELDGLERAVRAFAGIDADGGAKLGAIRKLLHESGPWNDHRPFSYDQSDPLGHHIPNKLLHVYLGKRRGQCVSMPVLFLILGDRLGLDVALATAPEHFFVRYTGPDGRVLNLETTSGGHPARAEWFRKHLPMTDLAIESGLYMRSLSRREGVALMATTVAEHLREEGRYEELIAVCGLIRESDPRAGMAMLMQSWAYGTLLQREFERKYPVSCLVPERLRARRLLLMERNNSLMEAAVALGWQPAD
ncbi:MAG TPA: transglutaminase family protein [Allosphingosinicella sp.]|jgi:hypothetical protein